MLFAVILIGVISDQDDPKALLEADHKEPAVDGRRLPFFVQAVSNISGDVLESATKVCRKILLALGVFGPELLLQTQSCDERFKVGNQGTGQICIRR